MTVTNVQYYHDQDFEDYLKMPGVSFSGLKDEVIIPSEGMRLGTRVHNYLLLPQKYDWQQYKIVKPIATAIRAYLKEYFGEDVMKYMEAEVAFTADFTHNGMTMKYKGRADLLIRDLIVMDIKIFAGAPGPAILRYGSDKQISGYCIANKARLGLIIAYNKNKKVPPGRGQDRVEILKMPISADSWEYETARRGEPITIKNFI